MSENLNTRKSLRANKGQPPDRYGFNPSFALSRSPTQPETTTSGKRISDDSSHKFPVPLEPIVINTIPQSLPQPLTSSLTGELSASAPMTSSAVHMGKEIQRESSEAHPAEMLRMIHTAKSMPSTKSSTKSKKVLREKLMLEQRLAEMNFLKKQNELEYEMKQIQFNMTSLALDSDESESDDLADDISNCASAKATRTFDYVEHQSNIVSQRVHSDEICTAAAETTKGESPSMTDIISKLIEKLPAAKDDSHFRTIMCRQGNRDLPVFTGNFDEWPAFINEFHRSTQDCQLSPNENLRRLEKCIRGRARDSVAALFTSPENVPHILRILEETYGRPEWIMLGLLDKARNVACPKEDKIDTFIHFSNVVNSFVITARSIRQEHFIENPEVLLQLVSKLPPSLRLQWGQLTVNQKGNLAMFSEWIRSVVNIQCSTMLPCQLNVEKPSISTIASRSSKAAATKNGRVFLNDGNTETSRPTHGILHKCRVCSSLEHNITACSEFLKFDVQKRWDFVKEKRLCFSCLLPNHATYECRKKMMCGIQNCTRRHNKLLHETVRIQTITKEGNTSDRDIETTAKVSKTERKDVVTYHTNRTSNIMLRIIPVTLSGPNGTIVETSALCDEGSTLTLLDKALAEELDLQGHRQSMCFQWTNHITKLEEDSENVQVKIAANVKDAKYHLLKNVHTVKDLALPEQYFNVDESLRTFDYLKVVPNIQKFEYTSPRILLGQDNCELIIPREVLQEENGPIVSRSRLGWSIHGRDMTSLFSNFTGHICQQPILQELQAMVKESFRIDESGLHSQEKKPSRDDVKALAIMENTVRHTGSQFEIGLLWKDANTILPESKTNALSRLACLERKLDKNPELALRYCRIIDGFVEKGYAKKLDTPPSASSKEWFLPHFAVQNINKPNKDRGVFDAAAKSHGKCLNDFLLQGPDLVPPLIAILWRFRRHKIAFCGDIKEMFLQIKIRAEDRAAQRFLFRGMDRSSPPHIYEMQSMIFGSVCSPSIAQFVKNYNAKLGNDPEIQKAMMKQHYVDDYLDGENTVKDAICKIHKIIETHKRGGFSMTNWITNSTEVLHSIPSQLRSQGVKDVMFNEQHSERVLGLQWNPLADNFLFKINFAKIDATIVNGEIVPTKRQVLQLVMSVFDPLQFLGPIITKAKILLQDVWRSGIGWDEVLPDSLVDRWKKWLMQLKEINRVSIARCYFTNPENIRNLQMHVFSDASEKAYAAAAYFRFIEGDSIKTSFISAKTRVAPLKATSIPRLELQAALLATRLAKTILKEVDIEIETVYYWSDSSTVLQWIKSESRRFEIFVGNRIGEIQEETDVHNWNWVPSKHNPADKATRESDANNPEEWLTGPKFLRESKELWPAQPVFKLPPDEQYAEELSQVYTVFNHTENCHAHLPEIERFSKWMRVVRTTAWTIRFVRNVKATIGKSVKANGELLPEEVEFAEVLWIKAAQSKSFPNDLKQLKAKKTVERSSRLFQLSPILDDKGIIRMNGRLHNADEELYLQQPIILSKNHPYTLLLVKFYHEKCKHFGQDLVVNELRQKYWIPEIRAVVKRIFQECQHCKILKSKPVPPEMSKLPMCRVTPYVRAFTYCGVDYFGPIEIKIGRRVEKRYGVLFTCLTVRAIHLEVASSLETDSAILAIRRFVSRRGCPKEISSDNATNFKGADKEFKLLLANMDQDALTQECTTRGIKWNFIPPRAPHMGGSWERMIGLVKTILKSTLREHHPKEETLATVFCEVESLVNSRPLTHISCDPDDDECITPNHFLLAVPGHTPLHGNFELSSRKQWKQSQALLNVFWKKWIHGYLPTLQKRPKWFTKTKPLQIGEVVIVKDEKLERGNYPLGYIVKVHFGDDGQTRAADVRTTKGVFTRPTVKLVRLDVKADW